MEVINMFKVTSTDKAPAAIGPYSQAIEVTQLAIRCPPLYKLPGRVHELIKAIPTNPNKILLIVFDFRSFISPKDRTIKSRYTYKKNGLFYTKHQSHSF